MAMTVTTTKTTTVEYDQNGRLAKQVEVTNIVETHTAEHAPTQEGEKADGTR